MKKITSLLAFAFLLFGAVPPARPAADELYKQFQGPPKKFSIIPYWSRAVANHRQLLKSIDLNGLLGPVRILPYMDASFTLAER